MKKLYKITIKNNEYINFVNNGKSKKIINMIPKLNINMDHIITEIKNEDFTNENFTNKNEKEIFNIIKGKVIENYQKELYNFFYKILVEARYEFLKTLNVDKNILKKIKENYSLTEQEITVMEQTVKGNCYMSTDILKKHLDKNNINNYYIIRGNFNRGYYFLNNESYEPTYDKISGHYWIQWNNYILDISLDQFNGYGYDIKPNKNNIDNNEYYYHNEFEYINIINKKESLSKQYIEYKIK